MTQKNLIKGLLIRCLLYGQIRKRVPHTRQGSLRGEAKATTLKLGPKKTTLSPSRLGLVMGRIGLSDNQLPSDTKVIGNFRG